MIKLIVLDVDGCLTDGSIFYSDEWIESKTFNVKDGLGIATWIKMGNHIAIITGRKSKIVQNRAEELGVQHLYQGIKDKHIVLKKIVEKLNINFDEVAVIGDDLNDFNMLRLAGKSFTPNNGVDEIKEMVDTVLKKNGGDGAVREMIDLIVKDNSQRDLFLSFWI